MEAATKAMQALLDSVQHHDPLDPEIMEYISSVLSDPDPESSLDVLVEVVASVVPSFSSRQSEEQTAMVLKLLDDVKVAEGTQHSTCSNDMEAVVAAFREATLQAQQQQQQLACSDITNTPSSGLGYSSASSSCQCKGPNLSALLELSPPGVTHQFLSHMLQHRFRGDMQATADWLLECPDVLTQQQQWQDDLQQQEQQRRQAELENKQSKTQLVERFDLQLVPEASRKPKYGVDLLPALKKGEQQVKVRYRDGKVVSSKGEKFIIETVGEEWDGGSKGKVYTKGKRGKGFA